MFHSRFVAGLPGMMFALAACGSGSGGVSEPRAIRALAYVVTDCHEDTQRVTASQRLEVVRGGRDPVTVAEIPTYGEIPPLGLCPLYGAARNGTTAAYVLAFQRMGISPDGTGVVFEVNGEVSFLHGVLPNPLTREQQGIFFVRADGSGLRRLGDPSREPAQRIGGIPDASGASLPEYLNVSLPFSPNGKAVTFTDRGPGPAGEDAAQVAILDISTGVRRAVTRLPLVTVPDPNPVAPAILWSFFLDDERILFYSRANPVDAAHPDGLNPEGVFNVFVVNTDGTGLALVPAIVPAVLPESHLVPSFVITGSVARSGRVDFLSVPGVPTNPLPPSFFPRDQPIQELFAIAPDQVLQLTNFGRFDSYNAAVDNEGQRAFFNASADPFGTNPSQTCQIFSVSTLGGDLLQLTHFGGTDRSLIGCYGGATDQWADPAGCRFHGGPIFDSETQTMAFDSSCDPLGANPSGAQLFSLRADGTGLRQLTALRGVVTSDDGVDAELPGPWQVVF